MNPARYKGAFGGRGSGKSHFFAELAIEAMILNPDIHIVCVREVQSSIKQSVKKLLTDKIKFHGLESYFKIQEAQIKSTKGDGQITFQGMQDHTAQSIKSLEGTNICWVEEAQSLSQRSLDMLRPTIREPGSELWFSWNPDQESDPIDQLLRGENLPKNSVVVRVNHMDNPWFPAVLKDEMEYDKGHDYEKYLHVWMGEYQQNSEARVFKNWEVREFETPDDVFHRCGIDFGYSRDPATMIRSWISGKNLYIDQEAYKVGCELDDLKDLFISNVDDCERLPCVADSARPDIISKLKSEGFTKITGSVKGANSVAQGVLFLQNHNIIIHPRCVHTIDEFKRYSFRVDPHTMLVSNKLQDKKNHIIDPLRYAHEAHRRLEKQQAQNTESIPIPVTQRWNDVRS